MVVVTTQVQGAVCSSSAPESDRGEVNVNKVKESI
ncbi:MAG: hypothetical protein QOF89_3592 [Acidobacteriota bacterium]|jgi:hypothetical protein|nr:hypothetical protein [Acidobacteriota bacterium]